MCTMMPGHCPHSAYLPSVKHKPTNSEEGILKRGQKQSYKLAYVDTFQTDYDTKQIPEPKCHFVPNKGLKNNTANTEFPGNVLCYHTYTFSFDGITKMEKQILTSNSIALNTVIVKSPYMYKETWLKS